MSNDCRIWNNLHLYCKFHKSSFKKTLQWFTNNVSTSGKFLSKIHNYMKATLNENITLENLRPKFMKYHLILEPIVVIKIKNNAWIIADSLLSKSTSDDLLMSFWNEELLRLNLMIIGIPGPFSNTVLDFLIFVTIKLPMSDFTYKLIFVPFHLSNHFSYIVVMILIGFLSFSLSIW